jgi:hypothetical protein
MDNDYFQRCDVCKKYVLKESPTFNVVDGAIHDGL